MFQVTQRNGRRFSAADAYLRPALERPNLEVRTERPCSASSSTASRAVGRARARGRRGEEVRRAPSARCCCRAGAIGSPQLLLLSGIGAGRGAAARPAWQPRHELPGVGATCRTTRS